MLQGHPFIFYRGTNAGRVFIDVSTNRVFTDLTAPTVVTSGQTEMPCTLAGSAFWAAYFKKKPTSGNANATRCLSSACSPFEGVFVVSSYKLDVYTGHGGCIDPPNVTFLIELPLRIVRNETQGKFLLYNAFDYPGGAGTPQRVTISTFIGESSQCSFPMTFTNMLTSGGDLGDITTLGFPQYWLDLINTHPLNSTNLLAMAYGGSATVTLAGCNCP